MKKMNCKLNTKLIVLSLVIMLMFSFAICSISSADIAYAQLPNTYLDANQDSSSSDYDWYFSEYYENLFRLKELIQDCVGINWTYLEAHPVVIAVIDTGIDYGDLELEVQHPLFTGAYNANGEAITLDPDTISPYDVMYRDTNGNIIGKNVASALNNDGVNDLTDTAADSHGTHVSGILAVLIHYLELEKYIKIMPIKASYPSGGKNYYNANVIFGTDGALAYATYNNADVINMSFASDNSASFNNSEKLRVASNSAVLVASAGNYGDTKNYYPAANENVIGVMNSTYTSNNTQTVYSSSTRGPQYDLAAPGYKIMSAVTDIFNQTKFTEDGDLYGELTGTSMATPMVSMMAALLTLKYRGLAANEDNEPSPTAIREFTKYSTYKNKVNESDNYSISYLEMDKLFAIDFLDDRSGEYVIPPEAIVISGSNLRQSLESIHEITLTASIQPVEYQYAPNLKWYAYDPEDANRVGDTYIGSGKTVKYTPDNRVGYTHIYAVLTYNNGANTVPSNELVFTMEYYNIQPTNTTILTDGDIATGEVELKTGDTVELSIKDFDKTNGNAKILWYVNDQLVSEGPTLSYKPENEGQYEIYVTVNSAKTNYSVTLNVSKNNNPNKLKMPMWQIWIISTAIVVALAGGAILIVYFIKKK